MEVSATRALLLTLQTPGLSNGVIVITLVGPSVPLSVCPSIHLLVDLFLNMTLGNRYSYKWTFDNKIKPYYTSVMYEIYLNKNLAYLSDYNVVRFLQTKFKLIIILYSFA